MQKDLNLLSRSKTNEGMLYGLTLEESKRLASVYGTNVDTVFMFAHALKDESGNLPLSMKAEILYCIHHEMVMTPSDYFVRRTGNLYFAIEVVEKYKKAVTNYMATLLSYSDLEKNTFYDDLKYEYS